MGNKKKLINKGMIDLFPKNIDMFVDVFARSGIVGMNVETNWHIVNDIDENLIELYDMFKTYAPDQIICEINRLINTYGLARERTKRNEYKDKAKIEEYKKAYMNLRNHYNTHKDIFEFYTLMFYSFSQQFRFNNKGEFNMPCGNDCFAPKNEEYIVNGCNYFSSYKTRITNVDFRKIFQSNNWESTNSLENFYYCDPPYLNTTAVYNENNGWTVDDEIDLYNCLDEANKNGIRWALSTVKENKGFKNQYLQEWLDKNHYNEYFFDNFTYMACGKGNSNAKEVLITNYATDVKG